MARQTRSEALLTGLGMVLLFCIATGCLHTHPTFPGIRFSKPFDPVLRLDATPAGVETKGAVFGDFEMMAQEDSTILLRFSNVTVNLFRDEDHPSGTPVCKVIIDGTIEPTQEWKTSTRWNGQEGQPLFVSLLDANDILVEQWEVGEIKVPCGSPHLALTDESFFPVDYYDATSRLEILIRPHQWLDCLSAPSALSDSDLISNELRVLSDALGEIDEQR